MSVSKNLLRPGYWAFDEQQPPVATISCRLHASFVKKLTAADDMPAAVVDSKLVGHAMMRNRKDLLLMVLGSFYLPWKHLYPGIHGGVYPRRRASVT